MFKVMAFMLLGIGCGVLLRKHKLTHIGLITMMVICALLFVLGAEVGMSKDRIEDPVVVIGLAVAIAVFSTLGSILFGSLLNHKKKNPDEK